MEAGWESFHGGRVEERGVIFQIFVKLELYEYFS